MVESGLKTQAVQIQNRHTSGATVLHRANYNKGHLHIITNIAENSVKPYTLKEKQTEIVIHVSLSQMQENLEWFNIKCCLAFLNNKMCSFLNSQKGGWDKIAHQYKNNQTKGKCWGIKLYRDLQFQRSRHSHLICQAASKVIAINDPGIHVPILSSPFEWGLDLLTHKV